MKELGTKPEAKLMFEIISIDDAASEMNLKEIVRYDFSEGCLGKASLIGLLKKWSVIKVEVFVKLDISHISRVKTRWK